MKLTGTFLLCVVLGMFALRQHEDAPVAQKAAVSQPRYGVILTADDAVERSLDFFPSEFSAGSVTVRKVSFESVRIWNDSIASGWDDASPAWIVAIRGTGLAVSNLIRVAGIESNDARPAIAGYWVWDANSGALAAGGALVSEDDLTRLTQMDDERIPIRQATEAPHVPTTDPSTIP